MKTLLLATGETHKLSPLTDQIVAPMLPILTRPVMEYSMEILGKQAIKKIDVSLYQHPGEIEAYFGNGVQRGLELIYHPQRETWGDAGAVRWAFNAPSDTILVLPADILIDLDLEPFLKVHNDNRSGITALVIPSPEAYPRQYFFRTSNGQITGVQDTLEDGCSACTGIYLLSPEIAARIPYRKQINFHDGLIPALLKEGVPVYAYEFYEYWNPLQSFVEYRDAQFKLCELPFSETEPRGLKFLTHDGREVWDRVWIGKNNYIHPNAQIAPVFSLHDNCQIEKDVQIGPNVVIGRNVVVDREATLSNAIILDHTYIGRLLNVDSKIVYKNLVIDIQTGEHITIKDQFLLAETEDVHVDIGLRRFASSVAAAAIFLVMSPLFLLISLFLLIFGNGVLFRKKCLHTDFRWFIPNEERSYNQFYIHQFQLFRKDGTYVPLGRMLEKLHLYRLPELFSVIRGELAFVGVKPLTPEDCKLLTEDWQKTRFNVPAGVTGLWYLHTDKNASLDQIVIEDSYYAATRSLKGDFQILFQTPLAWFKQVQSSADSSLGLANGN